MKDLALASFITLLFMFSMLIFLFVLIGFFTGVINLAIAVALTLLFNLVLFFLSPPIQDFMLNVFYRSEFFSLEEFSRVNKKLADRIKSISKNYNFLPQKIIVIEDDAPVAFTYGSTKSRSRIVLTKGLMKYLNDEELESVVAHELGHIVHWDFAIMTLATTLMQIFYLIYSSFSRASDDKKKGSLIIAASAFVFYLIARFMVLFLSRIREYYADEFSARHTSPLALSSALLKVGYGIISLPKDKRRLLEQTEALNFINVSSAREALLIKEYLEKDKEQLAKFLSYDIYSPWAKLAEINSTHPLTGKRIAKLLKNTKHGLQIPKPNLQNIYRNFALDLFFLTLPMITMPTLLLLSFWLFFGSEIFSNLTLILSIILLGLGIGKIAKIFYQYPQYQEQTTSVLELMSDIYASPVRGKPVKIEGKIVSRGVPGYVFSEDWVIDDGTGIVYVDYRSAVPGIGDLFFAITQLEKHKGKKGIFKGWFFRSTSGIIVVKQAIVENKVIRGHPILWELIISLAFIILAGILVFLF